MATSHGQCTDRYAHEQLATVIIMLIYQLPYHTCSYCVPHLGNGPLEVFIAEELRADQGLIRLLEMYHHQNTPNCSLMLQLLISFWCSFASTHTLHGRQQPHSYQLVQDD